jgi:shikimate 5-dehydrogenase
MDLNAFIFRDDTAELLGMETDGDGFESVLDSAPRAMPAKTALASGGSILAVSHFLGDSARHL